MNRAVVFLIYLALELLQVAAQTNSSNAPVLKGILFLKSQDDLKEEGVAPLEGIKVAGLKTLEQPGFNRVMEPFLGRPIDRQSMIELQTAVIQFYRQQGMPIVDVVFYDQEVLNGVFQIVVLEGQLGAMKIEYFKYNNWGESLWTGATKGWTKSRYLERRLRMQTNDAIVETKLQQQLELLERNPLREIEPYFTPGTKFGQSDLILRVHERRQLQFSLGYDDTGTRLTDLNRINAGFLWGKAFGVTDNLLNYQYTADPALAHLRAHTGDYWAPLPWGHRLHLFGYYLDAKADLGNGITLKGPSYQSSVRYEVPLPSLGKYRQQVAVGLDFKSSENSLALNAGASSDTPTEIFQGALGYTGVVRDPWGATTLSAQFYYSPGGITDKNSDAAFERARFNATADYVLGRAEVQRETHLPWDLTWVVRGTGQLADGNLLPTEQLGLGGHGTVRGYDERQVNSDQGWIISTELRSPTFRPLSQWAKLSGSHDGMQVLAFFDYGEGRNVNLLQGEARSDSLYSVGLGLRYSMRKNLDIRFDYAWQLHELESSPVASRGHVAIALRF